MIYGLDPQGPLVSLVVGIWADRTNPSSLLRWTASCVLCIVIVYSLVPLWIVTQMLNFNITSRPRVAKQVTSDKWQGIMVAYATPPSLPLSSMTRVFGLSQASLSLSFPWVTWFDLDLALKRTKRWKCQFWLYCICICICICISGLAITDAFPYLNRWGSYNQQHHCFRAFFLISRSPTIGLVWRDVGEDDDDKGRVCPDTSIVLCDDASCRVTMQSTLYVAVITIILDRGCICICI